MSLQSNEVKTIYLNTPKELNLQLLFSELKPVFIPKIQFLIHQINFNHSKGGFQLNIKNHSWLLGIKDGELSSIIAKLVDNDIIIKTGNHQQGKKSNKYSMVNPFNVADKDKVLQHTYQVDKYLFLQKWVIDGFVVKAQKDSAFIKVVKSSSSRYPDADARIDELTYNNRELQERIKKLEAELTALRVEEPIVNKIGVSVALKQAKTEDVEMTALAKYNIKDIPNYLTFALNGIEGAILKTPEFLEKYNDMSDTSKSKFFNYILDMDNGRFKYKELEFERFGKENDFVLQYLESESIMVA